MTNKDLTILPKEIQEKCSHIRFLHTNNSGNPLSIVWNQVVEEGGVNHMNKATVNVKKISISNNIQVIE